MAKTRTVEYSLTLDDTATALYERFVKEVEAGSVDISRAMDGATRSTRQHANETSRLTDYIRREKVEQREQTFLFKQGAETIQGITIGIAALTNTVGQSSEEMKKYTGALNAGFITFQGLNNLVGLMGFGGPWGIAIAVVGGLASAVGVLGNNSKEAAQNQQTLYDLQVKLGEITKAGQLAAAVADAGAAELKYNDLTKTISKMGLVWKDGGIQVEKLQKTLGSTEEIQAAKIAWDQARLVVKNVQDAWKADTKGKIDLQTAAIKKQTKAAEELRETTERVNDLQVGSEVEGKLKMMFDIYEMRQRKIIRGYDEIGKGIDGVIAKHENETAAHLNTVRDISAVMAAGITTLFSGVEHSAKESLKSILNGFITLAEGILLTAEAAAAGKAIFTFGVSLIADLAEIAAGFLVLESARAIVNSFHAGGIMGPQGRVPFGASLGPDERPAILKVGESVRTPRQEAALGGRGVTINVYGPVADERAFIALIQKATRRTGLTVDRLTADTTSTLVI